MEVDQQQEYFVVQKCWFDGPLVEPPTDYMALFHSQSEAEQAAYHSAHAYAAAHQAVVRTLLLQTGYAFSAAGKLYWVRRVFADQHHENSISSSGGAHVILTRGVIGGTGNANSRRGSEVAHNRVFVGPGSSDRAVQVMMNENLSPETTTISWIPMGPLANVMQGWPLPNQQQQQQQSNVVDAINTMDVVETSMKRNNMEGQQQFHYHVTAPRPAKRHCAQGTIYFHQDSPVVVDKCRGVDMCTFMSTS